MIRKLLAEAGHDPSDIPVSPIAGTGIEAEAAWGDLRSPEAYVGYEKAVKFASAGGLVNNVETAYATPGDLSLNQWALAGHWTVGPEFATLNRSVGALAFRFHARDVHLVLGGAADGRPVRFRVTVDGAAPGASHGSDVDEAGWGEVRKTVSTSSSGSRAEWSTEPSVSNFIVRVCAPMSSPSGNLADGRSSSG